MKKIGLLFSSLFVAFGMNAQTLTSSDFGSIGDSIFLGSDQTPNVSIGTPGSGKVWDFDTLNTETLDTLFFLPPSSFPNASNFPSANLAISSNEGVFFFEKTASAVLNHGFSIDLGLIVSDVNYVPPITLLQFPATLGTTYSTNSGFVASSYLGIDTNVFSCQVTIDSAMLKRKSTTTVTFDASGTLHLPTASYSNVLRAYSVETTRDSIFIYAPNPINCPPFLNIPAGWSLAPDFLLQIANPNLSSVILDTNRVYSWYAPNGKFAVCAIDVDHNNTLLSARFVSDSSQIGLSVNENQWIQATLYPNPAQNGFTIQSAISLEQNQLQLVDIQGRVIKTQLLTSNNMWIDTETLNQGIYLVQVIDTTGRVIYRNKLIKQ